MKSYISQSHRFGEYGVFLPRVTWQLKDGMLYRSVRNWRVAYPLAEISSISFFYGRVRNGPYRYYCRLRFRGSWSGKHTFSILKSEADKGGGACYVQFTLQLVEALRSANPELRLQYGQTPAASRWLIVAACVSVTIPVMLHIGIGDSRATAIFTAIIVPLAGILVWGAFKHKLRMVPPGESVPQAVFPDPTDRLKA